MKKLIPLLFFAVIIAACNNSETSENLKSISDTSKMNNSDDIKDENSVSIINTPTIKIGTQEWMKEDIKTTVYNNGDPIFEAKTESQWKNYGDKRIGCYRKLNNGTTVYNGFAINDQRGIIPVNFKLPDLKQFNQLINHLGGGESQSGKATRSMATYPIYVEDWVGDQESGGLETVEIKSNGNSGFNAQKGGFVYDHGALDNEGNCSYWWTSSKEEGNNVVVDIGYCSQDLGGGKGAYPSSYGFAVRAIKSL